MSRGSGRPARPISAAAIHVAARRRFLASGVIGDDGARRYYLTRRRYAAVARPPHRQRFARACCSSSAPLNTHTLAIPLSSGPSRRRLKPTPTRPRPRLRYLTGRSEADLMRRCARFRLAVPFSLLAVAHARCGRSMRGAPDSSALARPIPRAGRPTDWRGRWRHVRVAAAGGPDRFDRQPRQRLATLDRAIQWAVGGNEEGRPRERPHRESDGAAAGSAATRAPRSSSRLGIRW